MISIIIPVKNAANTIGECLKALLNQKGKQLERDYEVIVVDDGSEDETARIAEQYGVRVFRQTNAGPAAARNTGVRNAKGEILVFTDADCSPCPTWLNDLTRPFDDPDVVGVKGAYLTHQTGIIPRFVQLEYEYKDNQMQRQPWIDFIDTFSAAYRTDIFLSNGGFDESFREPSAEDAEFSFRLARKGYRMIFEPKAKVFHYHDRSLTEYFERKFVIGYWKAYMLQWIPEKIFTDSHTAPTQRIEIILLALLIASVPLCAINPIYEAIVFIILLAIFYILTIPFLSFIGKRDEQVLWIAPFMLIVRAAALGFGLLKGFIIPPKVKDKGFPIQSIGIRLVKRLIDLAGGGLGLLISAPAIGFSALLLRLESNGQIFSRLTRAGENGKPFTQYALRTAEESNDQNTEGSGSKSSQEEAESDRIHDSQVRPVERFLLRWNLDKLPQFWNVVKGEMSLVGPQAEELPRLKYYNDYQRQVLMIKPGITGPVQVKGYSRLDFGERLKIELDYLKNYSVIGDLKLILKSFSAIFSEEGEA